MSPPASPAQRVLCRSWGSAEADGHRETSHTLPDRESTFGIQDVSPCLPNSSTKNLMLCTSLQQHLQDAPVTSQKIAASGVLFSPFPSLHRLSASITIHWKLPRPAVIGKTTPALRDEYNRSRADYSSAQERQ